MKKSRKYLYGALLVFVFFLVMAFLPNTLDSIRYPIGYICLVLFPFFIIAMIVAMIRERIQAKKAAKASALSSAPQAEMAEPVAFDQTAPVNAVSCQPNPVTPQASTPVQPSQNEKKATNIERVHVRGVNNYVDNIIEVATENPDYDMSKSDLIDNYADERVYRYEIDVKANLDLVPEPDNEYDPNAIMVQADGLCIGYVPKGSTAHIRKLMESGRIQSMDLNIGGGKYKEVCENEDDEYEVEKGELKYSAILELHLMDN